MNKSRAIFVSSWLLCLAALGSMFPNSISAQTVQSSLVFVLDGSGSMWGRIDGKIKIVEAKQVMGDLLTGVPAGVEVGLVVYGHRRKGDCTDIETLAKLGTLPSTIAEQIQKISPKGKTPITTSLQRGADLLSGKEGNATLVLVSDGIETCEGDPCALAGKLRSQNIYMVIHTVGFGVEEKAAAQLQCIAEAGGGNYYHASSSESLREALFAVRAAVAKDQPAPPPPEALAPPQVRVETARVTIVGPGTIVLKPAAWVKSPPYEWHAVDPETDKKNASARQRDRLQVRKGEYQIVWRQTKHYSTDIPLTEIVHVPAGKTTEVLIDTGLRIVTPENIKPPYYWSLLRPGDEKPFARFRGTLYPQVLPAGEYRLIWRQSEHYSPSVDFGVINIEPGRLNEHILGSGIQIRRADWIANAPYFIELVKADGTSLGQWRGAEGLQLVPRGKYSVLYRQTEHSYSTIPLGEVTVPESGFVNVTINSGVKFVPQADAKPPYKAIFVHLDSGKEFVWYGHFMGKWAPVPLPPGRYKLDWWEDKHGSERMTLLDEFEIESGTLVEFEM